MSERPTPANRLATAALIAEFYIFVGTSVMPEPEHSLRSTGARGPAHRQDGREAASAFHARLANDFGADIDLGSVIQAERKVNSGTEL